MRRVLNAMRGLAIPVCFLAMVLPAMAQQDRPVKQVLFTNVHVFDGVNGKRLQNANVLIEGNLIKELSTGKIDPEGTTVIDGGGRTLIPGMTDNHRHTPCEALKMVTYDNAQLLKLSGPRNPYTGGDLGVVKQGACADLILVDGNPLNNLNLVAGPDNNFVLIMKDGKIYKNTLR